jgi:hypothetical protein
MLIYLQTSFFYARDVTFLFVPNIFLSIVLCYTILYGFDESILFLLSMGFLYDVFFIENFGMMLLATLVFSYGISIFVRRVMTTRRILGRMIFFSYGMMSFCLYQVVLSWRNGVLNVYMQTLLSGKDLISLGIELMLGLFVLWLVWKVFLFFQQKGFLANNIYTFS